MNWYRNDDLWAGFYDVMFSGKRAAVAAKTVETSPVLRFPTGSRVLDLCCGPGIYLVPFARAGHQVTGVDLSPAMLTAAKSACVEADVQVEIVEGDMLTFRRPGAFDVVASMFSSFGYFDDHQDNMRVLHNIHDSLVAGGQIVLEVFGKEFLACRNLAQPQVLDLDGETVVVRNTILDDWTRLRTDWTKIRDGEVSTAHIESQLYSATELKTMLGQAGFENLECCGGFDERPYDLGSKTLIVRGTRASNS